MVFQIKSIYKMKSLYYSIVLLLLISLIGCKSNYEKGVELIKEQKYDLALENLEKVKKGDDNYEEAISSINFINGLKSYNSGKYEESVSFLSKVYYDDSFRKTADSLMNYIKNSPKYHYEIGQKEFDASKYNLAYLEFIKIPESSEEYKFCKSKILFCQAINFKNENKLDTALIILHDINESDPIYAKVQNEIKYIERKSEFLKAKEYYENKKYDNALELLKKIDVNEDYYNEVKNLIKNIEEIQELNKYEIIKNVSFYTGKGPTALTINKKKYNIEMEYDDIYYSKSLCEKLFKEEYKFSKISFSNEGEINFRFEDNKKVGVSKIKIDEDIPYLGLKIKGEGIKNFLLDLYKISISIPDNNLVNQINKEKNKYKICLIYKVCQITVVSQSTWTDNWYLEPQLVKYYILDDNNNIVIKISE